MNRACAKIWPAFFLMACLLTGCGGSSDSDPGLTFVPFEWTIDPDAAGPGVHRIWMEVDALQLDETEIQALSGMLVWNQTQVDLCFIMVRGTGPHHVRVGDGFESDSQGPGCIHNVPMADAFANFGFPVEACVTIRARDEDHQFCKALDII